MAKNNNPFLPADRLRVIIEENPVLLGVMSRFGMSLGFGDKTVCSACAHDGIDTDTFLAVSNLICGRAYSRFEISLPSLMGYLRKAHLHFLEFLLPSIRRKLIEAINRSDINDVAFLLLKFFDDYMAEVNNHMQHENNEVFCYAERLLAGDKPGDFRITDYSLNHVSMTEKLTGLKDIFIRHYHVRDNEMLTSALLDIIYCGDELNRHCEIENVLFIPAVERLEKSLKILAREKVANSTVAADEPDLLVDSMTEREKEILCCVARGMANKEIAAHLCLSVHTVNTYRRNISAKLQIHSAAGLTIFAILHNLIDIKEVNPHI